MSKFTKIACIEDPADKIFLCCKDNGTPFIKSMGFNVVYINRESATVIREFLEKQFPAARTDWKAGKEDWAACFQKEIDDLSKFFATQSKDIELIKKQRNAAIKLADELNQRLEESVRTRVQAENLVVELVKERDDYRTKYEEANDQGTQRLTMQYAQMRVDRDKAIKDAAEWKDDRDYWKDRHSHVISAFGKLEDQYNSASKDRAHLTTKCWEYRNEISKLETGLVERVVTTDEAHEIFAAQDRLIHELLDDVNRWNRIAKATGGNWRYELTENVTLQAGDWAVDSSGKKSHDVSPWDAATAASLRDAKMTPAQVEKRAEQLQDAEDAEGSEDSIYTDGSPIYSVCNNDTG